MSRNPVLDRVFYYPYSLQKGMHSLGHREHKSVSPEQLFNEFSSKAVTRVNNPLHKTDVVESIHNRVLTS